MPPPAAGEPILTVPEELTGVPPVAVTGNEWVSLPEIDPRSGACVSCGALSEAARALVEFTGDRAGPGALLEPVVEAGGSFQPLQDGRVTYEAGWIPRWSARVGRGGRLEVTWLAPPGYRGFLVRLRLEPPGAAGTRLGLRVRAGATYRTIYNRRPLPGPNDFFYHGWTRSVVLEAGAGLPLAALALRGGGEEADVDLARREATLWAPAGTGELVVYCGLAPESDGAATTAVDLARRGFAALMDHATRWLRARDPLARPPGGMDALARAAGLPDAVAERLAERIRRNLWFALFFAHGRTLDGDRWVHLTSRSPRYYVSGAHWSRDSLLWAYPAVLELDPALARELLAAAFARYTRHPGEHSQYLDGTVLYPGWELDQAAAWPLALARYLRATADATILEEPAVRDGLRAVLAAAEAQRDPATGLIRTFLLPSDDPAQRPFVTYDNALYAQALAALAAAVRALPGAGRGLAGTGSGADGWEPARLEACAAHTRQAVLARCVVQGPFGPMFAWAVDGPPDPRPVCYDEPPGTLELLGPYGFARPAAGDPVDVRHVYENTVRWIYSPHNPYGPPPGRFATPTCPHARHPWLLSVAAGLLNGRRHYLELLAEAPLDSGFACETFDAETGRVRTGPAFATCAGFVAWAALEALRAAGAGDGGGHRP
ncbi:MAG TPA: glycoside hydrolase family 125 protein [Thermaerobacter sp.]